MKKEPRIAIGWIISGDSIDKFEIVGLDWDISEGELIGDQFLNPPMGHDTLWLEIREGLALDVYPYEYYPRFRIVFDIKENTFTVWGDGKILHKPLWQLMILKKYFLPHDRTQFRTDGLHYFSADPDSELVWDAVSGELKLIIKSYDDVREKLLSESVSKGIFWIIDGELVNDRIPCDLNGAPLEPLSGNAVSKSGSTYNHKRYWDTLPKEITHGKNYQYYPRGRVEIANGKAKIYLNQNVFTDEVKEKVVAAFNLTDMPVRMIADGSKHYECYLDLTVPS